MKYIVLLIFLSAFHLSKNQTTKIENMIKFAYTILYVDDVTKTISFYEEAFDFKQKFVTPDNSYGEIITGETTLSFASTTLAHSNLDGGFLESSLHQKPFGIEIAFTTEDVPATVKKAVEAGAIVVAEPKSKPWGQVVAYVRDPNGFLIEICTPVK
jgi:lactoylglutathione lyase